MILPETGVARWWHGFARDPAVVRFCENRRGYWVNHRSILLLFAIALLCDAISTVHFMQELGVTAELHPAVRWASVAFGPVWGPLVGAAGKGLACLCVTVYCRRCAVGIFAAATLIYLFAAWYNLWGVYLLV